MKLNFWQWLGAVLLVLGAAYYYYGHFWKPAHEAPTTNRSTAVMLVPVARS